MNRRAACAAVLGMLALATTATAQLLDDIEGFFARWQELEQEAHPAVADFYADDARILIKRLYPNGSSDRIEWTGLQYKTWVTKMFPEPTGKPRESTGARSLYSKTSIKRIAGGYKISGERYWTGDCSTDPDWYIVVLRDSDGVLTIVEENAIETVYSFCE